MNEKDQKLDGWDALAKKATRTEVKTKILVFINRDIDQHFHLGNQTMRIIGAKAQLTKDHKTKKSGA